MNFTDQDRLKIVQHAVQIHNDAVAWDALTRWVEPEKVRFVLERLAQNAEKLSKLSNEVLNRPEGKKREKANPKSGIVHGAPLPAEDSSGPGDQLFNQEGQ